MRTRSRHGAMNVQDQPVMGLIGVLRRALTLWRPYRVQGLLILLAMLLQQGFNTFLALSLKLIIDTALATRDGGLLLWILAGPAGGFVGPLPGNAAAAYPTAPAGADLPNGPRPATV